MAVIVGGASAINLDVGSTSRAARVEIYNALGYNLGNDKTMFVARARAFTAATTEGMLTLTPERDWVGGTAATSLTITSGKNLVLIGMTVTVRNAAGAIQGVQCRLRVNANGAAVVTSPILSIVAAGTPAATTNVAAGGFTQISTGWPNIIELSGTSQLGVSQIGTATAGNDFYLWGYEYDAN